MRGPGSHQIRVQRQNKVKILQVNLKERGKLIKSLKKGNPKVLRGLLIPLLILANLHIHQVIPLYKGRIQIRTRIIIIISKINLLKSESSSQ
jgi:hypothetical protein